MAMLKRVKLSGFKSIKSMDLEFRPLNVLIGANGSGKSNLISFFRMLNEMMAANLQNYFAQSGGGNTLLYYGPKQTQFIDATLEFEADGAGYIYHHQLAYSAGDKLTFSAESVGPSADRMMSLGTGHKETQFTDKLNRNHKMASMAHHLLSQCRMYHFNDTSTTARFQRSFYRANNRHLSPDAGNLAPFLLRFRDEGEATVYKRIVETIQLVAPFFGDFVLEPDVNNKVLLDWRESGTDEVFGPHQFSDGTFRTICLIALLLQPPHELPNLIIVDEPELGLHPYALNVVASLFKKAAHHTQVLISTQSTSLLDQFDPEDVIVVNREDKESRFTRPDAEQLESWLEDYSLGEVWEKNIIGGGPH